MRINSFIPDTKIFEKDITQKKEDNTGNGGVSFLDTLKQKLNEVNDKQIEANDLTDKLVKGDNVDIHQVMLSTEEAKMSLELAVQVRNKLLDAYQEINRMQL
ncbi:flagellar hook-basal body complex protein FliE [Clostridium manihotivorum]|uniref:Flagellar hook-basal body complex protein FliE n=1 Tax=Clostridium manihotivorum TaxID=2320868 RepID=A0A410DR22_9CLOT|nr:flagellar hook-basal body complex protein FliE [Clostridium manihotivorum]QAA31673.1 flagellar hook-basal body complex protein FliE [Clostridium manihotivorum]